MTAPLLHHLPRYCSSPRPLATLALLLTMPACHQTPAVRELLITGVDYAFQVPDTIAPGPITLGFRNAGVVPHEVAIALLKPGVTLGQVLELAAAGGDVDSLFDGTVGILIANPGDTAAGRLLVDLQPSRTYALGCNFRDGPDQPPHLALGMVASLRVK